MSYYTLTKGYSQELIKDMKDSNAELIKNPVKLTEEQKGNKELAMKARARGRRAALAQLLAKNLDSQKLENNIVQFHPSSLSNDFEKSLQTQEALWIELANNDSYKEFADLNLNTYFENTNPITLKVADGEKYEFTKNPENQKITIKEKADNGRSKTIVNEVPKKEALDHLKAALLHRTINAYAKYGSSGELSHGSPSIKYTNK